MQPLRIPGWIRRGAAVCALSLAWPISISFAAGSAHGAAWHPGKTEAAVHSGDANPCHAEGKMEISLACDYSEGPDGSARNGEPRIVINRAKLWFGAKEDSKMRVELTFTNTSKRAFWENRAVYIAIDDESGENHLRRLLPSVDFRKLAPGTPITFNETLRAPAFQPGRYFILLWIPSSDPALKFEVTHDFRLANTGVADENSGLNRIATFTVVK